MDFTLKIFRSFLDALIDYGYIFLTVKESSGTRKNRSDHEVILRHDVDRKPQNSLVMARIEHNAGIKGTYYFRITGESYNEIIIRNIESMGHEIGYHYEDLDLAWRKAKGERRKEKVRRKKTEEELVATAFESFRNNLAKLREVARIDTVCMHGSPISRYDSRLMWRYYDYGELSVYAEPYFDLSLDEMLYLTDTGRRWNGSSFSIRDKVIMRGSEYYSSWARKPLPGSAMSMTPKGYDLQTKSVFRNTCAIIEAVKQQNLPGRIMMTIHPQRWSDSFHEWLIEKVSQESKNKIKYLLKRYRFE
jgi:hypothetical protein